MDFLTVQEQYILKEGLMSKDGKLTIIIACIVFQFYFFSLES